MAPIRCSPKKVEWIVKAAATLHNILRHHCRSDYTPANYVDQVTERGAIEPGQWRQIAIDPFLPLQRVPTNSTQDAKAVREGFCTYFNTVGQVPWQNDSVNL